ncbi:hypothetical protein AB4156_42470, partial [Cupriavidus sp. 2MCAB6]|uniref:hypothetical protein n=1 Tax=Cupriavidus sp. 2MCAB6 TaxID=3232981 RepID=UPI003F8F8553
PIRPSARNALFHRLALFQQLVQQLLLMVDPVRDCFFRSRSSGCGGSFHQIGYISSDDRNLVIKILLGHIIRHWLIPQCVSSADYQR